MERLAEELKNIINEQDFCFTPTEMKTVEAALKRLDNYEKADEQGLLLKPKCKPGDYVWEVNRERNIVSEYEISSIKYGINKTIHYLWTLRKGIYSNLDGFYDKDLGETVFLTKPEADEVLKTFSISPYLVEKEREILFKAKQL